MSKNSSDMEDKIFDIVTDLIKMKEPKELIEECKKHLRDTKKYEHEYKKDIRKLITALERALTI